ncbi:MAG TPA: hypothetical protein VGO30_26425 [Mycobacterium sp.]|nr:hypothetical protein [Mycobacterium sp.]
MSVTADLAVSLDGFAAGPNQSRTLPFGEGVDGRLHTWMFDHGDENRAEIDAMTSASAYVIGPQHVRSGSRRVGPELEFAVVRCRATEHVIHTSYRRAG